MAGGYNPPPGGYGPPPGYGGYQQQPMVVVAQAPMAGWSCAYCRYVGPAQFAQRVSTGGWIVFVLLLLVCFPLFWIGLLMKENVARCPHCHILSK